MEDQKDNHCYECAGHAKAKGETCGTCDGTGKLNAITSKKKTSKKK